MNKTLLYLLGAFAFYELVLKPKTTVATAPVTALQPAANPISSLLNLITGKPATTATAALPQLAAGTASAATAASTANTGGTVYNQQYYQDTAGNVYDASGNLVSAAPAAPAAPLATYTTASGGTDPGAIDPSTGDTYSTDFYNGD
jgi:hypothetical protein